MASVINTNSLSLLTQNNLNKSQSSLNTAIQRLSSGLRINSAKDDAAGQAIANRFTANIKGLTQAQRNANDGISMAQTTEGALSEINTNLQRIRELTVQANNATNSIDDRKSIQAEIEQRMAEIKRTSEQTDFNGTKVLNSDQTLKIQVGAKDGETIDIALKKMGLEQLGLTGFNVDGAGSVDNKAATAGDLVLAGFEKASTANANGSYNYSKDVTTQNAAATSAHVFANLADGDTVTYAGTDTGFGVAATGNTYTYDKETNSFSFAAADVTNANVASFLRPAAGGSTAATVTIGAGGESQNILIDSSGNITAADDGAALYLDGDGNLTKTNAGADAQATMATLTASMSTVTTGTGGTIKAGDMVLTADATTGGVFDVANASISADALKSLANAGGYSTATHTVAAGSAAAGGAVTITAGGAAAYVDANGALTAADETTETTTYIVHTNGSVTDDAGGKIHVDAKTGAFTLAEKTTSEATEDPLAVLDEALARVDNLRSDLGAVQNRFDSVISNLGTTITNLSSSRSRIEDADYATEVSNMTRANILQQAGTSVLAQANQTTQGVLSLLR